MTTTEGTTALPKVALPTAPAGMGKWNRKKRLLTKNNKKVPSKKAIKITKEERREKYTAIAKDRQIRSKSKNLVCFNCRETGHSVQHCPKNNNSDANNDDGSESTNKKKKRASSSVAVAAAAICYKCGSTEHALAACPKRRRVTTSATVATDDLPFATCFVCRGKGHLASTCPNNANGIYVNGSGECKHCGSKQHRGTDCPDKKRKKRNENDEGRVEEHDFSDLLEGEQQPTPLLPERDAHKKAEQKKRVVNF